MMTQPHGRLNDRNFTRPTDGQVFEFSILIVGGSTAAYAAALGALRTGAILCWVMPQDIVGGQWTSQALPAADDSPLMAPKQFLQAKYKDPRRLSNGELFCLSRAQRQFRDRQRQLQPVQGQTLNNPGGSWVSHFSVTPVTAAIALNEPLIPYIQSGHLTLIPFSDPIEVLTRQAPASHPKITGVIFQDHQTHHRFTVNASIVIEGTDLGDLLEVGQIPARVGQEARSQTNEAILPEIAHPECQQSFTYCAILENSHQPHPIGAPIGYDREPWLQAKEFTGIFYVNGNGRDFYSQDGIFRYRRLSRQSNNLTVEPGNVTVLNWGDSPVSPGGALGTGNDFKHGVLVGNSRAERQEVMKRGRDRTQAYIHFLQTQVAPDLSGRSDLSWTPDGIALEPYIRESRRGIALTTIRHEDVGQKFFPNASRARTFNDSVGIGHYHYLDFHPNLAPGHVDLGADGHDCLPFTIALGALIPLDTDQLILSAKNIGTTHITNAGYRMHPVEWAIGEASGYLAAFAQAEGVSPRTIAQNIPLTRKFQGLLTSQGIPIFWFDDISHDDPDFEAIQILATAGIVRTENTQNLNFNPEGSVNRGVVAVALVNVLELPLITPTTPSFVDVAPSHFAYSSIETLKAKGIVSGVGNQKFAPSQAITRAHFAILMSHIRASDLIQLFTDTPRDSSVLRRRELSRTLYRLLQINLNIDPSPI